MRHNPRRWVALVVAAVLTTTAPAGAVELDELSEARDAYRLVEHEAARLDLEARLAELRLANGPYDNATEEFSWAVERWRPVVAMYFPADRIDWALRIIECESHGDPEAKNPRSTASGLFQHLGSLWDERTADAGWDEADIFDPFANIAMAAWLLETGGPGHWVCKARV